MVATAIFTLHGIAAVIIFVSRKKQAGLGEGFLAVGLFGILFSVGWTIFTMMTRFLVPQEGLAEWFDRDAVTLTALTIAEAAFYLVLRPKRKEKEVPGENSTSV